jgi:hypothetical protein
MEWARRRKGREGGRGRGREEARCMLVFFRERGSSKVGGHPPGEECD